MAYDIAMRIIACVSTKGGSGKSTLAASIAVAAVGAGLGVAVVDTDPQKSLEAWARRRDARGVRDIAHYDIAPAGIAACVADLQRDGFIDLVVIDTAGVAGSGANLAARAADIVLIPVKPTSTDMAAVQATLGPLKLIGARFAFVVSQVPGAALDRARKAAKALQDACGPGTVAGGFTGSRVAYDDAMALGMGPTDYEPRGPAADEVMRLWTWIDQETRKPHG